MTRQVVYSSYAKQDLSELYSRIARESGFPNRSETFISAILDFCDELADRPFLGQARDDLRPGLRVIGFRRRVVVAFAVDDHGIQILGVYYGGRDYESLLTSQ